MPKKKNFDIQSNASSKFKRRENSNRMSDNVVYYGDKTPKQSYDKLFSFDQQRASKFSKLDFEERPVKRATVGSSSPFRTANFSYGSKVFSDDAPKI